MNLAKIHAHLEGIVKGYDKLEAKVGWFNPEQAFIAYIHEFGAPSVNIPPRPFIRPTVAEQQNNWVKIIAGGVKAGVNAETVLEGVGLQAAGDIKKTIANLWVPPLKESTVKARARRYAKKGITGSLRKPLMDTKIMYNSCINVLGDKNAD
jgi:hypothetical protein